MMLGDVIAEKAETLVGLRDLDAFFEKLLKRNARSINVVEDAKFHIHSPINTVLTHGEPDRWFRIEL